MITDVNIAEDWVMDVGAEDVAVFELCADFGGAGRCILLSLRKMLRLLGSGSFGGPATDSPHQR